MRKRKYSISDIRKKIEKLEGIPHTIDDLADTVNDYIETTELKKDARAWKNNFFAVTSAGLFDFIWINMGKAMSRIQTYTYHGSLVLFLGLLSYRSLKKEKKHSKLGVVAHTETALIQEDGIYWITKHLMNQGGVGMPKIDDTWMLNLYPGLVIPYLGHIGNTTPYVNVPIGYVLGLSLMGAYLFKEWRRGNKIKEDLYNALGE